VKFFHCFKIFLLLYKKDLEAIAVMTLLFPTDVYAFGNLVFFVEKTPGGLSCCLECDHLTISQLSKVYGCKITKPSLCSLCFFILVLK
jgi:hypothetical protein